MNTSEIRKENLINLYNDKGERHGYWERYYDNGQLSYKGNYVNGNKHGYWEIYFDNGNLYYKGYYDMGEKVDYNPDEPKVIELTLTEIANKLNIDVNQLRIKE
jgi:antitoxin component YwqK of YwqJK toxin-antitoxin module